MEESFSNVIVIASKKPITNMDFTVNIRNICI